MMCRWKFSYTVCFVLVIQLWNSMALEFPWLIVACMLLSCQIFGVFAAFTNTWIGNARTILFYLFWKANTSTTPYWKTLVLSFLAFRKLWLEHGLNLFSTGAFKLCPVNTKNTRQKKCQQYLLFISGEN